ncbi:oxygen-independent coproporphyrinogen III oxidase [Sphingomonas hylomeconis]|uniref:Coproporphyrinogen-III oxidase n=1 Tax=Sphingomonas hylomeconis TaxID=1395958 RepID=A0ABV7SW49_9SPHN|nr:oxygen-independent coproporphyrinogen III oxidase [Sphingomonas hylomeconis]
MQTYIPELATRSVSRYTSYPTAAEFHDGIGAAEQRAAIAAIDPGTPVSLYLHIPFCHAICWYCGCNTGAIGRADRLTAYLATLEQEIDAVAAAMRGRVIAIHLGGGSPNALAPEDFVRLVDRLRTQFDCADDLEIAAELDPRTLDADYAAALARAGVTRVSLGVQTFSPHIQHRINRLQPLALVQRVVGELRDAGIARINLDLMYGLPGQHSDDLVDTVTAALALDPDRIALFGYAHMPALLSRQRMIDGALLPDAAARFAQSRLGHDLLVAAGYAAIGFDHFAKPADSLAIAAAERRLRRNFQGFTDEIADTIIGLGASAISQYDGLLVQNEKHVGRYRLRTANGGLAGARGVARSADDRLRGAVIERLLCDNTVDLGAVAKAHGMPVDRLTDVLPHLAEYAARGLVAIDGNRIELQPAGLPYGRLIAAQFDRYRSPATTRFSLAV